MKTASSHQVSAVLRAGLIAIVASLSLTSLAMAQQADYPNKPIRLVVPFSAGGATDFKKNWTILNAGRRRLTPDEAKSLGVAGPVCIAQSLESGAAALVFGRMVAAQGGPQDFIDRWPDRLPSAPVVVEVPSPRAGFIVGIDGEALGHAVVHLGGGRLREGDRVNPSVGLADLAGLGEDVTVGVPLAMVHAATEAEAQAAVAAVQSAYRIGDEALAEPPLIQERIA